MTSKPLRAVTTSLMVVLVVALAACEVNGSGSASGARSEHDRSGLSSDYGSPSMNDE